MGALDHPGCFYSCDEYTDEGLVLLIHKTKSILKDIEERAARPSSRSLLPRRRPTRRPQHLARRRCASPTSARSSATWPQLASQLSRVVGLLAKSLTTLGRSRSRVASARRRSARSPPPTSLASLARFSLVVTSVAGENNRAAAAAAAADAAAHDATSTSATPISATPATRRGRRSSRTPTLVDDDSDDAGGYADDDDDGSRSCLTPHSHLDLEYYSEMALAAADEPEDDKPDDDDYKRHMPEVDDGGMLRSTTPTATEVAGDGDSKPESDHGGAGARAQADELAHVGTFWSYNGDVWRSEPNEQYEHFEHDEYDDDEYDDGDYHDDDDDHNEEDGALFIQ